MAGLTDKEVEERRKGYLDSLDEEISSSEWETLLLSAEGISSLRESEVARLHEWGDRYASEWTVLVCVRHPVNWVPSVMQERLKQGETLQQLYENPPKPRYHQRISNSISVFGRENVRVFDFDSAAKSAGGIVGSFAEQAGLAEATRDFLSSRAVRANESLSLEAAHVLDSLNRQRPIFVDNVRAPHRAGPGHELSYIRRIEGQKFHVPDSIKDKIRSQSREDIEWLNETFVLDLYRDITEPAARTEGHESKAEGKEEEPGEALGGPTIDSIAEVFGELVTADVFRRALDRGRKALSQGNLERAEKIFQEAARLDPNAQQPKKLLEEVAAKQQAITEEPPSQEKPDKLAGRASFLRRFRR
jgi:hypothetical protein